MIPLLGGFDHVFCQHAGGDRAHAAGHGGDGSHDALCSVEVYVPAKTAVFPYMNPYIDDDLPCRQMICMNHARLARADDEYLSPSAFSGQVNCTGMAY